MSARSDRISLWTRFCDVLHMFSIGGLDTCLRMQTNHHLRAYKTRKKTVKHPRLLNKKGKMLGIDLSRVQCNSGISGNVPAADASLFHRKDKQDS